MARRTPIAIPGAENDAPSYRYWGSNKPPKNAAVLCAVNPRVATDDPTKATLRLYGPIDSWGGYWGTSAKEVAQALDALGDDVTEIQLRVNSPGGSVFEGLAILNLLRAHPATVTAVVDGLAASAASYIVAGCDARIMSPGTQMMIHDPWSSAWGCNAAEMKKAAETLDKIAAGLADLYADVAGGTSAAWRAVMLEEVWYTAAEAVAAGLADEVAVVPNLGSASTAGDDADVDEDDDAAWDLVQLFDLSAYQHPGRDKAPAPPLAPAASAHRPPAASADGSTTTEGGSAVAFSDEQMTTLRATLGLPETADEAAITAAVAAVVEDSLEDDPKDPTVPKGHVVIPAAKLADLEESAKTARDTAKALHEKERKEFLDSVRDKFLPANRAAWEAEYDRDPAATKAHFDKAPVLVPTSEMGHGGATEDNAEPNDLDSVRQSDEYKNWRL